MKLNSLSSWAFFAVFATTSICLAPSTRAAVPGPACCDLGDVWNTSDELSHAQGLGSLVNGMAHNIYATVAVGYDSDAQNNGRWLVRRSWDGGGTWHTTQLGLSGFKSSSAGAIATGPSGEMYAVGFASTGGANNSWIVQKSMDSGASWTTIDVFNGTAATPSAVADSVAVDGNGVVYAAGSMYSGTQHLVWTVRRSLDGGATWHTVDTYQLTAQRDSVAFGMAAANDGSVFVAGRASLDPSDEFWTVRSSTNGTTWKTVDQFALGTNQKLSQANGVAISASGDVTVVGNSWDSQDTYHWIARHAQVGAPATWNTTDDRVAQGPSSLADAWAATYTRDNELFVTGYIVGGPGAQSTWPFTYLTRRGTASSTLADSDVQVSPVTAGQAGFAIFGARAAATDAQGDVFTGGAWMSTVTEPSHWLIRKLGCLGSSK